MKQVNSIYDNSLYVYGEKTAVSEWISDNTDITIGFPYFELDLNASCPVPDEMSYERVWGCRYRGTVDVLQINDDGKTAVLYFETSESIPLIYDCDVDRLWSKSGWLDAVAKKYPHLTFSLNSHSYDDDCVIELEFENGEVKDGWVHSAEQGNLTRDDRFILGD